MKAIIQKQREERDYLLSLNYMPRKTKYNVDELLQSKQIKLITGPRRVGKSTLGLLMLKNKNFAYLNFDDANLLEHWDENIVNETLKSVYPNYEYLLLDEIQNLDNWDLWVSKLYRNGVNMFITGSNAKLLSSEMATVLTGRYIQIELLPFGLKEALEWEGIDNNNNDQASLTQIIDDYLCNGGYPEIIKNKALANNYLSALFDSIILKDIAKRHKVRNIAELNDLATYLISNFCNQFSANKLTEDLGFSSVVTTKKFMNYLKEPYLFFYLPRYNNKLKLMQKAPQKVYIIDNGFVTAQAFNLSDNYGRLLENQVFIELLRRAYNTEQTLFYYMSRNGKEVDFVLRNGTSINCLIQVCYDLSSKKTEDREVNSLIECAEELKCTNLIIISRHENRIISKKAHNIKVIPISEF